MTPSSCSKRNAYIAIGGLGLLGAATYLACAWQLPFGQLDQPGAAVFPIFVSILVALTSLMTLYEGLMTRLEDQVALPTRQGLGNLLRMVGLMLCYLLALPWLGQLLSSLLFACLFMRMLSPVSWARSIFYGAVMAGLLYFAFVVLLKVQMPRGVLLFW